MASNLLLGTGDMRLISWAYFLGYAPIGSPFPILEPISIPLIVFFSLSEPIFLSCPQGAQENSYGFLHFKSAAALERHIGLKHGDWTMVTKICFVTKCIFEPRALLPPLHFNSSAHSKFCELPLYQQMWQNTFAQKSAMQDKMQKCNTKYVDGHFIIWEITAILLPFVQLCFTHTPSK